MQLKDKAESRNECKTVSGDESQSVSVISNETIIPQPSTSTMMNLDNFEEHRDDENEQVDRDPLNFINTFMANQKLNDYLNAAVEAEIDDDENVSNWNHNDHDNCENDQNQENINPNSRYVQNLFTKMTLKKNS